MILTKAIAGIARSGATRAGWPVLVGFKVPLYALSNVARSGATRSNYIDTSHAFISVGGIEVGAIHPGPGVGVLVDSVTIDDSLSSTPTTGALTAYGWVPVEGADVVIRLGSKNNLRREFGGTILKTRHRYAGDYPIARNMLYDSALIDYAWGLQRKKVSGRFKATTVGAIATSLMTGAPAGYSLAVEGDIAVAAIDEITFTEQNLDDAIGQLAKRVGGDWQCDYLKVVRIFFVDTVSTPPAIINTVHRSMAGITWDRDLSQVVTRVYVDAGGSDALEAIAPGDTLIPVATAAWYPTTGGVVLAGPQRVQYAGVVVGGGGSLVGPGASPTGAPNVSLLPGAGVDIGTHDYAVTFTTPSGETVPGPRLTVPVGLFLAPASAPTPGPAGPGATGPDPGVHDYAVSFVISGGETVPGPRIVGSTGLTPPPDTGPTPDAVSAGPGPDPGQHDYAVGFGTATGSTPPGPIGGSITTGPLPNPATAPSVSSLSSGPGPDLGTHYYYFSFVRPEGETGVSLSSGPVTTGIVTPPTAAPYAASVTAGTGPTPGTHYYASTFVRSGGETTPGPTSTGIQTGVPGPPHGSGGSPSVSQDPNSGNYSYPGSGGQPGDSVNYAYTLTTLGQSDESAMGPSSGAVTIVKSLAAGVTHPVTNMCSRQVYVSPQPGEQARLYVSVNGGGWQLVATTQDTPRWIQVAGTPTSGNYAGPGHGPTVGIVNLAGIPTSGDASVTARRVYRDSGAGLKLLTTIGDNTTTTYTDTAATVSGAAPPSTNGTLAATVHVSGIAVAAAGAGVTARKLYRYTNLGAFGLVATIADNTTTTYTDTKANAALGPAPSGANTTTGGGQTVHLSSIPRGTGANGAAVTARNLYRRSGGAGLRYLATIWDNSTSTYTDTTPNASLGAAPSAVNSATLRQIPLSKLPIGNSLVLSRKVYRTIANTGGGTLKLVATIADNVTTDFLDTVNDAALGAAALTVGTAQAAQVQLSAIPLGAASVTARKLYRTKAGLAQLQLVTTIADNVTAAWLDVAADATLGANAPTSDTSTLKQPEGNILAGSPSLPCASVAAFRAAGGWAIVASQILRYTGISGNAITGIPATGPGAITATITFNTTAVAAPLLTGIPATGVGAIRTAIVKGDAVDLFIQEDDVAAQTALSAQLGGGADGIVEDEIQDRRLSATEARARARARLALLAERDADGKVGLITVHYTCRDINTRAGATVTINLGPPINLRGDFLIQRVNITQFGNPHVPPTYSVEASSARFTFEELLRVIREAAA